MSMPLQLQLLFSSLICMHVQIVMPNTISDSVSKTKLFQIINDQFTESSLTTLQRKYFNETRGANINLIVG